MVMGCAVLIGVTQISWQLTLLALLPMPIMALAIKRNGDALHERFFARAILTAERPYSGEPHQHPYDQSLWP